MRLVSYPPSRLVPIATDTPSDPHDELPCALWPRAEQVCDDVAVVSVVDPAGDGEWGCERHAAAALSAIDGAKISRVGDWAAARRLLRLPWSHREAENELTDLTGSRHQLPDTSGYMSSSRVWPSSLKPSGRLRCASSTCKTLRTLRPVRGRRPGRVAGCSVRFRCHRAVEVARSTRPPLPGCLVLVGRRCGATVGRSLVRHGDGQVAG